MQLQCMTSRVDRVGRKLHHSQTTVIKYMHV